MATAPLRLTMKAPMRASMTFFNEIEQQGIAHLQTDGFKKGQIDVKRSIDMRYVGQVHECTVDIGTFTINAKSIDKVKDAFHRRHEELYTYAERHSAVEVVNIESTLYGRIRKPKAPKLNGERPLPRRSRAIARPSSTPPENPRARRSMMAACWVPVHQCRTCHHRESDDDHRAGTGLDGKA